PGVGVVLLVRVDPQRTGGFGLRAHADLAVDCHHLGVPRLFALERGTDWGGLNAALAPADGALPARDLAGALDVDPHRLDRPCRIDAAIRLFHLAEDDHPVPVFTGEPPVFRQLLWRAPF